MIEKVEFQEEKVSSTALRKLIRNGEMEQIPSILGRAYTVGGTVVHGDKRGRQIGFPTANVGLSDEYLLPPVGVYAVRLQVHGEWYAVYVILDINQLLKKMSVNYLLKCIYLNLTTTYMIKMLR